MGWRCIYQIAMGINLPEALPTDKACNSKCQADAQRTARPVSRGFMTSELTIFFFFSPPPAWAILEKEKWSIHRLRPDEMHHCSKNKNKSFISECCHAASVFNHVPGRCVDVEEEKKKKKTQQSHSWANAQKCLCVRV